MSVERNDIRGQKKARKRSERKLQAKSFQGWRQAGELSLDEPGVASAGSYDIINFLWSLNRDCYPSNVRNRERSLACRTLRVLRGSFPFEGAKDLCAARSRRKWRSPR